MMDAFPAPKAIHHHPLRFRRFFNTGGSHAQIALCEHHIGVPSCCARCRRWTSSARAGAPHRHEMTEFLVLPRKGVYLRQPWRVLSVAALRIARVLFDRHAWRG